MRLVVDADVLFSFFKKDSVTRKLHHLEISPDPKDIRYFALALWLGIPLWTNEKRLKGQDKVLVFTTSDFLKMKIL